MGSNKALMAKISRLERIARTTKPKISPALAQWCREQLNARLDRIYENDPVQYEVVMAKIQARVAQMRSESNYYE